MIVTTLRTILNTRGRKHNNAVQRCNVNLRYLTSTIIIGIKFLNWLILFEEQKKHAKPKAPKSQTRGVK